MKRLISVLSIMIMLVCTAFSLNASAEKYTISYDTSGILQMGDFDSPINGYIVYYPKDLAKSNKKYPVAVWANGTNSPAVVYTELLIEVAKAGYIVVASSDVMSKNGKSQIKEIDYIFKQNSTKNSVFYNKVDTAKVGAFGHSQGGASCVNAAAKDKRIGAIVSIAGASTKKEAGKVTVPSLFLTASRDYIVLSSAWVKPSYDGCNGPAVYASLKNGIHSSCCVVSDVYAFYIVKWFNAWLSNESKSTFLPGGTLSKDSSWRDYKSKNFN